MILWEGPWELIKGVPQAKVIMSQQGLVAEDAKL